MGKFWIKEWNIGRVCIAIANEWLCGYYCDGHGRYFYLGYISLGVFNREEE